MSAGRDAERDGAAQAAADLGPLLRWLGQQPVPVHLELLCPEHPEPSRGTRRTAVIQFEVCLADLPASCYLELIAGGATSVTVRLDGCAEPRAARLPIATANHLLAACGRVERVRARDTTPERAHRRTVHGVRSLPVPRRSLLLLGGAPGRPGHARAPERPPTERARVLDALRSLCAGGSPDDHLADVTAPSTELSVTGCTGCEVCVRACPTGALRLHQLADATDPATTILSLRQMPADCLDCGRCIDLCPQGAIAAVGQHSWADLLSWVPRVLVSRNVRTCTRCGAGFADAKDPTSSRMPDAAVGSELCPVCTYRRANPFGSMVVSAAARTPVPGAARLLR